MPPEPQSHQPRFADHVRPLISRWWLIAIAVVVATGGVYAYYARKPNVYSTSTLVYYNDPGNPVTGQPDPAQATDRAVEDQATLLSSVSTATAVAAAIGYHGTPESLLQKVTISSKEGQDFVQINAQAGAPNQAATIANAFANQLASQLSGHVTAIERSALKSLQTQLSQIPKSAVASGQGAAISTQISRLQTLLADPQTVAQKVAPASVPTGPSAPKPARNALFAFILALVGSIGLAYGLERFDRRLKDPEELDRAYGRSVLAVLPHTRVPAPMHDGEPELGPDFREPFRVLRANVELATVDAPPRTIVVTSAMPGEGKSTVVRNLALALRETGKRVAVVDLDLRHPTLAPLFGAENGDGVTEVLRGEVELDEAAQRIKAALPAADELLRSVNGKNGSAPRNGDAARRAEKRRNGSSSHGSDITLLVGGARPANPPAVLASEKLIDVLGKLQQDHDVVLIDSAPVLAVSDTVPLLRYADAAIFVARLDVTTRDTAKRLMDFAGRVPDLNLLGIVANDLSRREAGSYGYGYGYGYKKYGDEPKSRRRARREVEADAPKQTA